MDVFGRPRDQGLRAFADGGGIAAGHANAEWMPLCSPEDQDALPMIHDGLDVPLDDGASVTALRVAALKVGVPFALIGAIIGEFMAASRRLGYMIQLNTNQFDTTGAVSGILVLMLAGGVCSLTQRRGRIH